ncbi:inositol-3-phosphate synthase [Kribbella catacumbae]|uniref:inositol-3-phosphate synthase n=1 Tax=Kribbella catacumbae TaxID=460086 RepID=UPI0003810840|nr:inositol-3-phosphate synthase [Kribbella catacumbae]
MSGNDDRVGVWLFGARGSVATTTIAGAAALRHGGYGAASAGLVTELPDFAAGGLVPIDRLVFGGHDVVETPLVKRLERLVAGGVLPHGIETLVAADLAAVEADLVTVREDERGPAGGGAADSTADVEVVRRWADDIRSFADRHRLRTVVAVNVASTEAPYPLDDRHRDLGLLRSALDRGERFLPASSLAALAAFEAGAAFVDFTPSTSIRPRAVRHWAVEAGLPFGGQDAKTGETLVKSVLAPMFSARALKVHAWSGTNLLGGGDGATLADPRHAESKNTSKERGLAELLGEVDGEVHIDYVEELGDWKTAWDHVVFSGFLGTRMTMQFTWQGCDSALAAPLVLDLARLSAAASERGHVGAMPFLGFFFKDPVGSTEHALLRQYDDLARWVRGC